MPSSSLTLTDVSYVAHLARLPVSQEKIAVFHTQLQSVLEYMSSLQSLPTQGVSETSQVTGLVNIFREDEIDRQRQYSQQQALCQASRTHNGYIVVPSVWEREQDAD